MIWYKNRDDNRLANLSKALGFQAVPIGGTKMAIEEVFQTNDGIRGIYIESFEGSRNAQAKAELFIRWLSTIIADSKITDFVYDDSCFLQFARDEIEEKEAENDG